VTKLANAQTAATALRDNKAVFESLDVLAAARVSTLQVSIRPDATPLQRVEAIRHAARKTLDTLPPERKRQALEQTRGADQGRGGW